MPDGVRGAESGRAGEGRLGMLLVFLSALAWSFGGMVARFVEVEDGWTMVFWRSVWASVFLLAYMLWRDGLRGTIELFRAMGLPGVAVSLCFTISSVAFVIALGYTTVANIVLVQAGVPLFAALLAWIVFRERVSGPTWGAIAAVIFGVGIMVSDSLGGSISPIGDGLALTIAVALACATVIPRRFSDVRMTPATCLGTIVAACLAAAVASELAVPVGEMGWLFVFGALNLGLGLALFASGARLVPAAWAALLGTFEPLLAPVWVWLVHGEIPSSRTIIGGLVVMVALVAHLIIGFGRAQRPAKPGTTGVQHPL